MPARCTKDDDEGEAGTIPRLTTSTTTQLPYHHNTNTHQPINQPIYQSGPNIPRTVMAGR